MAETFYWSEEQILLLEPVTLKGTGKKLVKHLVWFDEPIRAFSINRKIRIYWVKA